MPLDSKFNKGGVFPNLFPVYTISIIVYKEVYDKYILNGRWINEWPISGKCIKLGKTVG